MAPGGLPPSRWTWQRLVVIAGAVVVVGLVLAAIVLATRKPAPSPPPVAVATASPSASPSPSPTDTPTPTPTPTLTPTPTSTAKITPTPPPPVQNTPTQQANLLFPGGAGPAAECGSNGTYSGCPVTSDLVPFMAQWRINHFSDPKPLCRCPADYQAPVAQQDDTLLPLGDQGNTSLAAVQITLTIAGGQEKVVVLFARQANGSWLAYDTYCDSRMNSLKAPGGTTCSTS